MQCLMSRCRRPQLQPSGNGSDRLNAFSSYYAGRRSGAYSEVRDLRVGCAAERISHTELRRSSTNRGQVFTLWLRFFDRLEDARFCGYSECALEFDFPIEIGLQLASILIG